MTQEIEIIIDNDKDTTTTVQTVRGFAGGACVKTLAQVQAGLGLGKAFEEGDTPERYKKQDVNAFINSLR